MEGKKLWQSSVMFGRVYGTSMASNSKRRNLFVALYPASLWGLAGALLFHYRVTSFKLFYICLMCIIHIYLGSFCSGKFLYEFFKVFRIICPFLLFFSLPCPPITHPIKPFLFHYFPLTLYTTVFYLPFPEVLPSI